MSSPQNASSPGGGAAGPNAPGPPPQQIIIQQRESAFGRYGKLLIGLLVFSVLVIFGMAAANQEYFGTGEGPKERYHSLSKTASDKIAIVAVRGTIIEGDDFVKQQLDRIRDDDSVKAIVLRVNSPGGTVTKSDYIYHHVRELADERKLPLVVSMGSICASGGYYISMAVGDQQDAIFAERTTWTGSIGVVIPYYDLSGLLGKLDVKDQSIASRPLKLMGSPTHGLSEEQKAVLEELVAESFADFKEIVKSGRPQLRDDPETLDQVTTGQIFTAKQALELGLVDKLGFLEDAVARAAELADLDPSNVRCVEYVQPPTALNALLGVSAEDLRPSASLDVQSLLDLTTPRAYYHATWLPSLVDRTTR